ncbi:exosome complex component CSL4-like [Schistocerca gregaria]|uniref:exosome complex component CSL4-like n=1 Tax=Schistocerca gregaria TaxID=7010 RepID=UPI00211E81A5|nr:exosome complex component CSL4-like [Schistocerca gregaria]
MGEKMPEPWHLPETVVPGMKIAPTETHVAGYGCYEHEKEIVASLSGFVRVADTAPKDQNGTVSKPVINIESFNMKPSIVPKEHDRVLAQVININPRVVMVSIVSVKDQILSEYFSGSIRVSDVYATQPDKVEMYKCFRPGDVIQAEIISLGDFKSYYLSTAKNEYGVVFAKSMAGVSMVPIAWNMMQCPKTKMKEYRKVAKLT